MSRDPYCLLQKYRSMTLFSGNINCLYIFEGFSRRTAGILTRTQASRPRPGPRTPVLSKVKDNIPDKTVAIQGGLQLLPKCGQGRCNCGQRSRIPLPVRTLGVTTSVSVTDERRWRGVGVWRVPLPGGGRVWRPLPEFFLLFDLKMEHFGAVLNWI